MATSNKSKKILEKARKIAAKTKKKKVSKVDVKKKTTSYPEGQNAPQSKKYTQESDKTLSAKATGWRWTKEGAKKLGKSVESKPTTSDIEKYRNETFKLKGKPNKSGPKGVGDGSHRYLYVERRADKADITRKNKLAKGGVIDVVDKYNNLVLPKEVYSNGKIYKGNATFLDGYNGYTSSKDDGYLVDDNGNYLKDKDGKILRSTKRRGITIKLADGGMMAKGGKTKKFLTYYEVYDENTDKTLNIQAYSFEEAEEIASTIEYDNFKDGEDIEYGEMARGGKIPSSEVADFKKYVKEFYGKDEMYSEFFPPLGASNDEINLAVSQYIEYCKTKDDQWGGGDSFDREIVRDIMLYNRGTRKGLEYQRAIKEIFAKDKKEYGGILQPMIGGVNADPRFDIYNTTMFAKRGAELPEGGTVKPRVVPIYLYELTYSKHGKKGTFVSKVEAKSEDDAINKWVDQTNRSEGVYTIIDVVKSSRNRMEDGGEMAHGGSTHEQGYDDREDESLAMRHGKIASKDFVGSHARREHSRRDDAHFETRHKKAYGGLTDSSIELLD